MSCPHQWQRWKPWEPKVERCRRCGQLRQLRRNGPDCGWVVKNCKCGCPATVYQLVAAGRKFWCDACVAPAKTG